MRLCYHKHTRFCSWLDMIQFFLSYLSFLLLLCNPSLVNELFYNTKLPGTTHSAYLNTSSVVCITFL
jgi:hypothetical protein